MAWSTRQLAELAGTSLRTVRHYHEVGLLPEPERGANGYKRYGVAHLVRLLRVKRMADLGLSLAQIAGMGDADEHPEEALRELDAEVAATIERLRRVRAELAVILRESAPTDLPPELARAAAAAGMSDADRTFAVVMTRVLSASGIEAYRDMVASHADGPAVVEFDHLPADADEPTRRDLAERLVPEVREVNAAHPGVVDAKSLAPTRANSAASVIDAALEDIYNPAQVDVLRRVRRIIRSA